MPRYLHVTGKQVLLRGKVKLQSQEQQRRQRRACPSSTCASVSVADVVACPGIAPQHHLGPPPRLCWVQTQTEATPKSRVTKGARRAITRFHIPSTFVVTKKCMMCRNTRFRGSDCHLALQVWKPRHPRGLSGFSQSEPGGKS